MIHARIVKKVSRPRREIGEYFNFKRLEAGITELAVASYLGCPVALVRDYEAGRRAMTLQHVYAVANFLNVDPSEVLKRLG